LDELVERFLVDEVRSEELPASYNVAPTDPVYAVAEHAHKRLLGTFHWGLVGAGGPRPINARAETLVDRPLFRGPFARRRCLLPADGVYEWQTTAEGKKQPYFISAGDGGVLALAGVWSRHDGVSSCAIITTVANGVVGRLHDRMPVILPAEHWEQWLDRTNHDVAGLSTLLAPAPDDLLRLHPVGTEVNSVRNNGPQLTRPI
jgi:putative SOS response-associated peptidase YedK